MPTRQKLTKREGGKNKSTPKKIMDNLKAESKSDLCRTPISHCDTLLDSPIECELLFSPASYFFSVSLSGRHIEVKRERDLVCLRIYMCIYIYMCICTYIYKYIYMYICMCVLDYDVCFNKT